MLTPNSYSLVINLGDGRIMDLDVDANGNELVTRGDAIRTVRSLVIEDGFAQDQIEILPMYNGPLFMPEYTTNHTESVQ